MLVDLVRLELTSVTLQGCRSIQIGATGPSLRWDASNTLIFLNREALYPLSYTGLVPPERFELPPSGSKPEMLSVTPRRQECRVRESNSQGLSATGLQPAAVTYPTLQIFLAGEPPEEGTETQRARAQ